MKILKSILPRLAQIQKSGVDSFLSTSLLYHYFLRFANCEARFNNESKAYSISDLLVAFGNSACIVTSCSITCAAVPIDADVIALIILDCDNACKSIILVISRRISTAAKKFTVSEALSTNSF